MSSWKRCMATRIAANKSNQGSNQLPSKPTLYLNRPETLLLVTRRPASLTRSVARCLAADAWSVSVSMTLAIHVLYTQPTIGTPKAIPNTNIIIWYTSSMVVARVVWRHFSRGARGVGGIGRGGGGRCYGEEVGAWGSCWSSGCGRGQTYC